MPRRSPTEIAVELMATAIVEVAEDAHDLAVAALPANLRTYRASARRLAAAGRDLTALASAMEVLIQRG